MIRNDDILKKLDKKAPAKKGPSTVAIEEVIIIQRKRERVDGRKEYYRSIVREYWY